MTAAAAVEDLDPVAPVGPASADGLALESDQELVARTRCGSREAFALLWTRHYLAAKVCAQRVGPSWADAEDLASEAFARVLDAINKGNGPTERFRPYLYQVIRNLAADRRRRDEVIVYDLDTLEDDRLDTERQVIGALDQDLMVTAFYAMKPRERQILWLREVEDLPPREIATQMGLGARHVSTLLGRARQSFAANWLQASVRSTGETGGEHGWCLDRVGRVMAGQGTDGTRTRMRQHLKDCESCSDAVRGVQDISATMNTGLASAVVGVTVAALGVLAPVAMADAATPPPLPNTIGGSPSFFHVPPLRAVGVSAVSLVVFSAAIWPWQPSQPPQAAAVPVASAPAASPPSAPASGPTTRPRPVVSASAKPSPRPAPNRVVPPEPTPTPTAVAQSPKPPVVPSPAPLPAILIGGIDLGPDNVCYPIVSGTGLAGSQLAVSGGGVSETVRAGADGTWRTDPLVGFAAGGHMISVLDPTKKQKPAAQRATITSPPTLGVTRTGTDLIVIVNGLPGLPIEVDVDGVSQWTATLDSTGRSVFEGQVPTGVAGHDISVQYSMGCDGPHDAIHISS